MSAFALNATDPRASARRRCARSVVVALMVVGITLPGATTRAVAQASGGGELGPGYVRATAADLGAGTFTGSGIPVASPSTDPPLRWVRAVYPSVCVVFVGDPPAGSDPVPMPGPSFGFPLHPGPAVGVPAGTVIVSDRIALPSDAVVVGAFVQEIGDDPSIDGDIVIVPRCVRPGEPLLANPPSAAAIWQETPLPRAVVQASPPGTRAWPGITRLGTDFRSDGLGPTTASVSLDGYDVDVTAVPIAYAWSFGDGTNIVTPDAGSPRRVAYLRRGDFIVTRYVVWEGTAHITAFGGDFGVKYLGTVTIPERVPYHVAEIRALLRSTPGRG